jgi:DNA-directed RNA polymerase specialized sigma24 family protein
MRGDGLERLPPRYAQVLRMARAGRAPKEIAEELEVSLEALPALLTLAEAKLARVSEDDTAAQETWWTREDGRRKR